MTRWTGELHEYMMRSRQRQAGDNSFTSEEEMLVRPRCPKNGSGAFRAIRCGGWSGTGINALLVE